MKSYDHYRARCSMRPPRTPAANRIHSDLVEENGLLVHEGEAVGDLAPLVERTRNERDADVLGLRR